MNTLTSKSEDNRDRAEVWIGLAHVKPQAGDSLLGGALGAYVVGLALATDEHEYALSVARSLQEYGFEVLGIEDVEPFARRIARCEVARDICQLAAQLTANDTVMFHTFHTYDQEEHDGAWAGGS